MLRGYNEPSRSRIHRSHFERAKLALEQLALEQAMTGASRLPAEDRLAEAIGFSRPTVRSALLALQKEGKVFRQHGVGTFINRHALQIRANLAEDQSYLTVIEQLGYEPDLHIAGLSEAPLPDDLAKRAGLPPGAAVTIDRIFSASQVPAVVARDYVPTRHIGVPATDVSAERSTVAFVRRWTPHELRYSVASLAASPAPDHVATLLRVDPGSPLLVIEHHHFDERDEIVAATLAYVHELIRFSIVRTNLDG